MDLVNLSLICIGLNGNLEDRIIDPPKLSEDLDRARVLYIRREYAQAYSAYANFIKTDYIPLQDAKDFAACCSEVAKNSSNYRIAESYYTKGLSILFRSMNALACNEAQSFIHQFEERYIDTLLDLSNVCINGNEDEIGETSSNKFIRYRNGLNYLSMAVWHVEKLKEQNKRLNDRIGRLATDSVWKITTFGNSLLLNTYNARKVIAASEKYAEPIDMLSDGWTSNIYSSVARN